MTTLEDETKRLVDATKENTGVTVQVGHQIASGLKGTGGSIDKLADSIKMIDDRNFWMTIAFFVVAVFQLVMIGFQIYLTHKTSVSDDNFKRSQVSFMRDQEEIMRNQLEVQKQQERNYRTQGKIGAA
ncbi:MAG: hypothetical protein WC530_01815 [Candidatus Omnitrophota bacterium]|jgi:hypothetical protein